MFGMPDAQEGLHGLGPYIFGKNEAGDIIVGHDGGNRPAINNAARINLNTKDGIIVFETGSPSFASALGDEWIFWKTGIVSFSSYTLLESNKVAILLSLFAGYFVISILSFYIISKKNKPVKK